jgi:DNA modification methylase/superfamily II DNA or RNA helicase
MEYHEYLESKTIEAVPSGFDPDVGTFNDSLFPFQSAATRWAVQKGRAALFEDCGLGKTIQSLEWSRQIINKTGGNVLILAPLCVSRQTASEGRKFGFDVNICRSQQDVAPGINITNYEMLGHFIPSEFAGVVLDESSILKSFDGKTRTSIIESFKDTQYKLACTATPCPNDIGELSNHAEFLGIMSRAEFLATWFVHDDDWRLKGHAVGDFWKWIASWALVIRKPSDIGFDDTGYDLPELIIRDTIIETHMPSPGHLFNMGLKGISDRATMRKLTVNDRVKATAEEINKSDDCWLVWCGLNDESKALEKAIIGSVALSGSDSSEKKETTIEQFINGEIKVLITKPKIAGHGMNFQHCHRMAFVGMGDSFEQYYQAIRRCYRFGQRYPVDVLIVTTDVESVIVDNVRRKEQETETMMSEVVAAVRDYERDEIQQTKRERDTYMTNKESGEAWDFWNGDSCELMKEIASDSMGLSVFSPPFSKLYTYSNTPRDLGNCADDDEFFGHFRFIISELLRITKPGRMACVHVAQIPAMISRDGYMGLHDFRGKTIEAFKDGGWVHWGEVAIDKCPQAQAIRTKAHALMFKTLKKDAAKIRPGLADYILVFRKPGENAEPIVKPISNEEWITWAHPIWFDIRESDTLQKAEAREDDDEAHICPLQLGTIERCIKLWSNEGDTVFSPFGGIGSEIYQAVVMGRRGHGIELKSSYWRAGVKNLKSAAFKFQNENQTLFNAVE